MRRPAVGFVGRNVSLALCRPNPTAKVSWIRGIGRVAGHSAGGRHPVFQRFHIELWPQSDSPGREWAEEQDKGLCPEIATTHPAPAEHPQRRWIAPTPSRWTNRACSPGKRCQGLQNRVHAKQGFCQPADPGARKTRNDLWRRDAGRTAQNGCKGHKRRRKGSANALRLVRR